MAHQLGDPGQVEQALLSYGYATYRYGDYSKAEDLFNQAIALSREFGDNLQTAWLLNHLGDVKRAEGEDEAAAQLYAESQALFERQAERHGYAAIQHNLGYLALHRGNWQAADNYFTQSL